MKLTSCNKCGQTIFVKILEASIPALCPVCGPAYKVAKTVSNQQSFSPEIRSLASIVCGGFLILVTAKMIDDFFGL